MASVQTITQVNGEIDSSTDLYNELTSGNQVDFVVRLISNDVAMSAELTEADLELTIKETDTNLSASKPESPEQLIGTLEFVLEKYYL